MDCTKWTELGLLYTTNELSGADKAAYKEHCLTCASCRAEQERYKAEKTTLFSSTVLCECTSSVLDAKVTAACMKIPRTASVSTHLFSAVLRRAVVPVLFLTFGFGGGVYVASTIDNANNDAARFARQNSTQLQNQSAPVTVADQPVRSVSENDVAQATDSTLNRPNDAVRQRGNIGMKGVVPVDLQGK